MYDRADFIPRPIVGENCTWDVSFYEECLPFVQAAQRYFQSGEGPFDLAAAAEGEKAKPLAEGFRSNLISDTMLERWSLPTRFGSFFAARLESQAQHRFGC